MIAQSHQAQNAKSAVGPFLKWAGGKRWLISAIEKSKTFPGKYFEPFLGGGAIFFARQPNRAVLSDINSDLIETYRCIRDIPKEFARRLLEHSHKHNKTYYYETRAAVPSSSLERAARFVYLNRTCWNGLYRVNASGKFNVPIGTTRNVLLDTDSWEDIADRLSKAVLLTQDFEITIDAAKTGDVIFADPPYTVKHNLNGFIQYNESLFSWDDQIRLSKALSRAALRGVVVLATNAAHQSVKDLYHEPFTLSTLSRASVLAGNSAARGRYDELFITANYE